ncbi:MAG: Uma2 family endonuclease [Aeromicrobium sp.]|uniref:Uma2 family endonuclease n=1 Tax=Aeromicrobium sp. TaxID=1871063 RepID=UPI0039E3A1F2
METVPDDGHRYELVDGVLIVSPAPSWGHQRVLRRIFRHVDAACAPENEVIFAPFDVILSENTSLQPDLVMAARTDFAVKGLFSTPLLAVEVLSPSTRGVDLLLKKERLERAGCPHYWVVDPDEPSVTAWALADGSYHQVAYVCRDETFSVASPVTIRLTPAELVA